MISELRILFVIFLSLIFSLGSLAQETTKKMTIDLPLLEINHPTFISTLDSIIFENTSLADDKRDDLLHFIFVSKDSEWDQYLIEIFLFPRDVLNRNSPIGYFYIKDFPIIVGCDVKCFPDGLFKITSRSESFDYILHDAFLYDPPSWAFLYGDKQLKYLDIPQHLVRRLGFKPCED